MQEDLNMRFAAGNQSAFEEAIDRYGARLLRYVSAVLCDYHEAEDVVQEVFLLAMKNCRRFDGKNLSAWLYKIAYRTSLNRMKRRRPLLLGDLNEQDLTLPAPEENTEDLWEHLKVLKPKERALLFSRIYEGKSYAAISETTGVSQAVLRKRYERAKKKLAESLTEESKTGGNAYENNKRADSL